MKSNRKKRIIAAVLCMVMVLSSSISALAGEEIFVDIPEASEAFTSEPMVVTEAEPAAESLDETEVSPEISFADGDVTADTETEAPVDPISETPVESAPETLEENTAEEPLPETPSDDVFVEEEAFADFGDGTTNVDSQVFSEETELKQEFVDEAGNVVQRVTAKLPAGAFAAETSSVTMEVSYLDADSENYLKSMMNENIQEGMQLGSYVFFNVQFKVNGEKADALKPVVITIEGSGLTVTDAKKANVFYFDPADPSVEGDRDELKEIPQRAEVLESLQAAGQSTENIEDYDLSEITFREDGTTDKVIFEGRKSTIYGCYTEEAKPVEEIPAEPTPIPEEPTPAPEETTPSPEEPGTEEPAPETVTEIEIISDEVNLRTEPNAEADNVAAVAYTGERFPLLENVQMEDALWYKIQYTYPETGETAELYVRSDFAKIVDESLEVTDDEAVDLTEEPGMVNELTYEDDKITVSVSAAEEGIIPDGASLSVKPITAENAETQEQYEEVAQHVEEKVTAEEKEIAGFLAYDISFLDAEGNKVEPNGEVKVSMNYKQAAIPETVTEEKAETTEVSVFHLEEDETGAVQNVVDMTAEGSASATVQTTENAEIQSAEFHTTSFSVYTVVWTMYDKKLELHFVKEPKYSGSPTSDISGELGVKETTINIDGTGNFGNVSTSLKEIGEKYNTPFDPNKSTGYKFKAAHIDNARGTVVTNISYNPDAEGWVYYADSRWNNWQTQSDSIKHVYLVYEEISKGNVQEIPTINAPAEKIDIDLFNYNAKINETHAAQQGFKFHSNVRGVDGLFSAGQDLTYTHAYNQRIHQDYLKKNLIDGFPILTNGTSLDYLFQQSEQNGVTAYPDLTGLLSKDAEGYYNYDSSENHAQLTDNNSKLTVYNAKLSPLWSSFPYGNFLPFNKLPFDVKNGSENSVTGGRSMTDVWFGMNISFSFMQPKDGRLNGNPMRFEFRGDDDVWVFIDGVKVLDIGGIHDKKAGSIDFQTGTVKVEGLEDVSLAELYGAAYEELKGANGKTQYLDSIFKKVNGQYTTFRNFGAHDFRFFYLERGGGAANCKLRFNIPTMDKDSINISKEIENYDEGAYSDVEFSYELYVNKNQTPEKNVQYTLTHADGSTETRYTDKDSGKFVLKHGEQARFDQYDQGTTYYVKEVGISSQTYDQVTIQASGVVDEDRQSIEDNENSAQSQELEVGTNPTVTFLNRCAATNMKHLVIKKVLANGTSTDTYRMKVTVGGMPYTGKYKVGTDYESAMASTEQSADEQGIVTLGADQVAVILGNAYSTSPEDSSTRGIPSGTSFKVEELRPNGEYISPKYTVSNAKDSNTSDGFSEDQGFASGVIELQHNAEVTVTNQQPGTAPDPDPLDDVPHNKYIDYLGSGTNGQTNLTGAEYYRLYLDVKGIPNTIPEPADIVLVLDYSSSMKSNFSNSTRWDYVKKSARLAVNTLLPDNREQDNRIGIVWFDKRANEKNVLFTKDKNALLNNINGMKPDSGTNYQAAFWNAQDMLNEHGRADSKKFVIFVTDGEPYQYYSDRAQDEKDLKSDGTDKAKKAAIDAAKLFTNLNGFYAVSVGKEAGEAFLKNEIVANVNTTDKNTLIASDSAALTKAFTTVLGSITKQIGNVTIKDSLSEYVDFADEVGGNLSQYADENGVISGSSNDNIASQIGLKVNISQYENAEIYNAHTNIQNAKEYTGEYTYKIDLNNKTIEVNFGQDYFLERDTVYTVSFNVMLTDQATQEAVKQNNTNGDLNTDYPENNTSSDKPGLYSNKEASLTFERVVNGEVKSDTKNDYEKPVVQPYEKADWQIVKVNEGDTLKLPEAKFTLSKDNNVVYTGTSDDQGIVRWVDNNNKPVACGKIAKGSYVLKETVAPRGYSLTTDTWTVEIGAEGMKPVIKEMKTNTPVELTQNPKSSIYELKIKNMPVYDLPSTGGNGIYVYMIGGVALMMAAMFILYKMKDKGVPKS